MPPKTMELESGYSISDGQAEVIADRLARALNAAEIPCVLWGHYLLSAHGVPTYLPTLDLVVPDASLAAASEILTTGTYTQSPVPALVPCPDTTTCPFTSADRPHAPCSFHVHFEGATHRLITRAVCLFVQSETLWFLPPLSASLASPRADLLPRYLALASDLTALPPFQIGMGQGVFGSDQTVVLVPRVHILLEALMRIAARDHGKVVGGTSMAYVMYIPIYVEKRKILDLDLLPVPFKDVYKGWTDDKEPRPFRDFTLMLLRALGVPVDASHYR